MIPSVSIGPRTLLNDCNHSATAIFWRSVIAPTKKADLWPTWRQEACLVASQKVFVGSHWRVVLAKGICTSFANSPPCRWGGLLLIIIIYYCFLFARSAPAAAACRQTRPTRAVGLRPCTLQICESSAMACCRLLAGLEKWPREPRAA